MNIIYLVAIIVLNLGVFYWIYRIIDKLPKMHQIVFMAVSVGVMYALISALNLLSGIGIDSTVNYITNDIITFLFVPIDMILFIPIIAKKYIKYRNKKVKEVDFATTIVRVIVVAIFVFVIEFGVFRFIKSRYTSKIEQQPVESTQTNEITSNDGSSNVITNVIIDGNTNTITNEINNTIN